MPAQDRYSAGREGGHPQIDVTPAHYVMTMESLMPTPPLARIYLDLSLVVLPHREYEALDRAPVRVIRHEYGAWIHVPPREYDNDDLDPETNPEWHQYPSLCRVLTAARELNADWVNLDRHAPDTFAHLPTFDGSHDHNTAEPADLTDDGVQDQASAPNQPHHDHGTTPDGAHLSVHPDQRVRAHFAGLRAGATAAEQLQAIPEQTPHIAKLEYFWLKVGSDLPEAVPNADPELAATFVQSAGLYAPHEHHTLRLTIHPLPGFEDTTDEQPIRNALRAILATVAQHIQDGETHGELKTSTHQKIGTFTVNLRP